MTESYFTPGPWRITQSEETIEIDGPEGASVCTLWQTGMPGDEDVDDPEVDANAVLIAAAPDLYEACTLVNRWCVGGLDADEGVKVWGAVRAALAKARTPQEHVPLQVEADE